MIVGDVNDNDYVISDDKMESQLFYSWSLWHMGPPVCSLYANLRYLERARTYSTSRILSIRTIIKHSASALSAQIILSKINEGSLAWRLHHRNRAIPTRTAPPSGFIIPFRENQRLH